MTTRINERFNNNYGSCSRAEAGMKKDAWAWMREHVANLELPSGWARMFTPGSLIVHNQKRTIYVKVTTQGEVFVDRKQRDLSYKSDYLKFPNIEDACLKARAILIEEAGIKDRVYE
jgi:hypothetical protein